MDPNPAPPGSTAHTPRVVAVPDSGTLHVTFLDEIDGVLEHWPSRVSQLCTGVTTCPGNTHRSPTFWKGYTSAECWDYQTRAWRPCVVEVTECLEEQLRGGALRGQTWALTREKPGKRNSRIVGQLLETVPGDQLTPAFDFRLVLSRIKHCHSILWGVPNPLVPQVRVQTLTRRAPSVVVEAMQQERQQKPATPEEVRKLVDEARKQQGSSRSTTKH